jgi:mono/diheme cytochrome c family protein
MKLLAKILLAVLPVGFAIFWWLSAPVSFENEQALASLTGGDVSKGEQVFWASGCASCHAEKGAKEDDKLLLGGGHRLETPFGTFITPNISPDSETGIGDWTISEFAHAMVNGVSPDGSHYYPAFPYTSYNKMTDQDLGNLFAYLKTLAPVARKNEPHELGILFSWRRPLGVWKKMFANDYWALEINTANATIARGRYLVEALAHCGECHTPRNLLGGLQSGKLLAGGPSPEGKGKIPNITPHETGIGSWSKADIVYYLESGFTPDFDSVGGSMTSVQQNMAKLPKADIEAIADYLKAIPAVSSD